MHRGRLLLDLRTSPVETVGLAPDCIAPQLLQGRHEMTEAPSSSLATSRLNTPVGPRREDQKWWNAQRGSAMKFQRYERLESRLRHELTDRTWPSKSLVRAPLWASV